MEDTRKSINDKMSLDVINGEKNKGFDIKRLKEMSDTITEFQNGKTDLMRCLLRVGYLSGSVTVNGDVWTRYGYILKDNKLNKDGIPFNKIYHLENIFTDEEIYTMIEDEEYSKLGESLGYLKERIVCILLKEKYFEYESNGTNTNHTVPISDIIDFSDKYFQILTVKLIRAEIYIWETLDFDRKDDRYFIARVLSKIGEFLNELIKGASIDKNGTSSRNLIQKAFKNLIEIRDILMHNCEMISEGVKNQNNSITEIISIIREHLNSVFCQQADIPGKFFINYQYWNAQRFEQDSGQLFKLLSGKHCSAENRKNVLNNLILKALKIIAEEETILIESNSKLLKKKKNKMKNKLENINKEYQSHYKLLNDLDTMDYPKVICMETSEEILKKGKLLKTTLNNEDKQGDSKNVENESIIDKKEAEFKKETNELINKKSYDDLLRREIEYLLSILHHSDVRKLYFVHNSFMCDYIVMLIGLLPSKDPTDSKWWILKDWIEKITVKSEKFNEEFQEKYPEFYDKLMKSKQERFYKNFQQRLDDTFREAIESLMRKDEIDSQFVTEYLTSELKVLVSEYIETEFNRFPELKKYNYIAQQTVLHLQQMILDGERFYHSHEELKISAVGQEDHHKILSDLIATSQYIRKERQISKGYRSCGLGHKLLSFDLVTFLSKIIGATINFSEYLTIFNSVLKVKSLSTVKELYDISRSLLVLYSIKESTRCVERALQRAESHPEEIEQHEWDQYYIKIFGKPRMICEIYSYLLDNYLQSLRFEDMYRNVRALIDNINKEELNNCHILEIKRQAGNFYYLIGQYFQRNENDYNKALESFRTAEDICQENTYKTDIANVLCKMKEFHKAKELLNSIQGKNEEPLDNMCASLLLNICSSDGSANAHSRSDSMETEDNSAAKMESFYLSGSPYIKHVMRDKFYALDLIMMNCKLEAMVSDNIKNGMSEFRLKELVEIGERFKDIKSQLADETVSDCALASCYLALCINYSQTYTHGDLTLIKDVKYIKRAKEYFLDALKLKDVLSSLSGRNALKLYEKAARSLMSSYICCMEQNPNLMDTDFVTDLLSIFMETFPDLSVILVDNILRECGMKEVTPGNDVDRCLLLGHCIKIEMIFYCDLQRFKTWLLIYYKIINLSPSNEQQNKLGKQECDLRELLHNLTKVLIEIVSPRNKSFEPNTFSIIFCRKKWNIEISFQNKIFHWKHNSDLSAEDLKRSVETELTQIGKLHVIYIFVLGYYKL